ncbi:origin recognition complex ORC subunit 5 [Nitzschia inconspicua]|uniref:Origin recognition complex ORC subunit 5 n=1 Tax=Nitzschia inconspicua TaxID=303405 RepID=A0A9K3KBL0_9STRA|nr:origin recognition complex ORC subunit 5 [Nitzschia inconspicua]KAG7364051.1 origin recognition complex ORC subunit 5 [Nitzschia inconspicua]
MSNIEEKEVVGTIASPRKSVAVEAAAVYKPLEDDDASFPSSGYSSMGSSDDDDDDTSSIDSSVNEENQGPFTTLLERQARNIERNNQFLGRLHEKYKDHLPPTSKQRLNQSQSGDRKDNDDVDEVLADSMDTTENHKPNTTGILMTNSYRLFGRTQCPCPRQLSTESSYKDRVQQLLQRYPHREAQIHQLLSLLDVNVSMISLQHRQVHVPAPIFCIGPASTGKTSIVCDVIETLHAQQQSTLFENSSFKGITKDSHQSRKEDVQSSFRSAYIDCSIIEPSSIQRLVAMVYRQLQPKREDYVRKRKKHTRPKKKRRRSPTEESSKDNDCIEVKDTVSAPAGKQHSDHPNANPDDDQADSNRRILPSRNAKTTSNIGKSVAKKTQSGTSRIITRNSTSRQDDQNKEETVESSSSAVVSLGRSLQQYYGASAVQLHSGLLILDQAEELLSLASTEKKSSRRSKQKKLSAIPGTPNNVNNTTNFLAEFLLLPKIMKLNITVIVLTNHATLDKTRLNNAVDPSKSLATISNGVHPVVVQFPSYSGNRVFCDILSTDANCRLVMGDSFCSIKRRSGDEGSETNATATMKSTFQAKVVSSFWNAIVQFASDSTRRIDEMVRLGRSLWPSYAAQLHPIQVRATVETIAQGMGISMDNVLSIEENKTKVEDELIRTLGTRFYTRLAGLSKQHELTSLPLNERGNLHCTLGDDTSPLVYSSNSHTFMRSCLLLAAFICQHNSASNDRKIFSSYGNGQRRKSDAIEDIYGGNEEDMAYGSSSRLRPFVLERVFSIFVTLVHLNPSAKEDDDVEFLMDSLGSTRLQADLSHLVGTGLLHPIKHNGIVNGEQIHLGTAKFTCSLAHNEALLIAKRYDIPLEQYLL